ncbi:calcium-responsive transactivator isoform X3 [Trachypithecus francoisi]|uniref:calcium-responsive transactivator isoform X3 n=1 Tax=Trachypithecus francoisi TaxID=54180 RepID=UPI00141B6F06|nr:calcium-responsive transactivator isoform X3 [Trachypithecus francoisi]
MRSGGGSARGPAAAPRRQRLLTLSPQMLDENHHLIQCILEYQSKGKTAECTQYQQILHRNLVYLATIADSNQNMQSLLPAPPTQNMNLGPGALTQSGSSQGLHSQGSLSDAISTGLPPSSLLQGQIGNGPSHVSMQQTAPNTLPTTSMSISGPGYSHAGPASQGVPMQGQGTIGNYVSRTNINMQSNPVSMMQQQAATSHYSSAQGGSQHYQGQSSIAMMGQGSQGSSMMGQRPMAPYRPSQQGSSQQYLGQEEYYGEQYSHSQGAAEPMGQQYYPDGHGDYTYQQSSYTEQSYDRSFEESAQHYYEGGNSQYSQQQAGYQQGAAQQQTYSQQQYPSQQSYPGQQQGYGPVWKLPAVRDTRSGWSPCGGVFIRGPEGLAAALLNCDMLVTLSPSATSACEACSFHAGTYLLRSPSKHFFSFRDV